MQDLSLIWETSEGGHEGSQTPLRLPLIPVLSGGRHQCQPPGPCEPLPARSDAVVGCWRGPQAARRTRDVDAPSVRPCLRGTHPPAASDPARSVRPAAERARSISWSARPAQAWHSPEEHARAEVGVLQRVGFHLGVHRQHLDPGTAVVGVCAVLGGEGEDAGPPAAAPVRSAGASQAAASGNRAPARPDPASRGSSGAPATRRRRLLEPGSGVSCESAGGLRGPRAGAVRRPGGRGREAGRGSNTCLAPVANFAEV